MSKKDIKKQKILFVIPRFRNMFGKQTSAPGHPHVGIASLYSFLREKGYQVRVYDEGIESNTKRLKEIVNGFSPGVIGVTAFSYCYADVLNTIDRIRKISKKPIILGGPHVSAVRNKVLEDLKFIDFAIKGEGEFTLLELLETMRNKGDFSKVKGLIWRKGKEIIENPDRPFISDLDSLPFPDYEAFELKRYSCFNARALPILTSRGCPYNCNFCSVRLSMGRGFRPRSPRNVVAELKRWYKKGFYSFDINDDCFTLDLERAGRICDLIIKNRLKITFQLYNGIRVDRINLRLLKKLKKAGCTFIAYGVESGNQEILRIIKKNIKLEQVRKAVEWTNKAGIKNAVNFIIGHPSETYERALETIKFAESLPVSFVNFYNLVPYPGTEVYEWARKNAEFLVSEETFLKAISYRDNSPIFETKEFTKEQREKIMKMGFALYEKKVLQFRLGRALGSISYYLTRIPFIRDLALRLVSSKAGWKLFVFLSRRSRE